MRKPVLITEKNTAEVDEWLRDAEKRQQEDMKRMEEYAEKMENCC